MAMFGKDKHWPTESTGQKKDKEKDKDNDKDKKKKALRATRVAHGQEEGKYI